MSVRQVRVGDVLALRRTPVELRPDQSYVEIGIRSFGRGTFLKEPVSGASLGTKRVYEIHPRDLLVSNVFAWEGAIAVAGAETAGCIGSHRFMTWVPASADIDVEYLSQFFASERGLEMIGKASPGSAGRNRTLGIKSFENLVIPLPDIAEQRRIAARLDRIAALSKAVVGRDFARAKSRLQESLLSDQWPSAVIGEVAAAVTRKETLNASSDYRMLGVRWYGGGLFVREVKQGGEIAAKSACRVEVGDLVYNRLFAWKGSFALADQHHSGCFVSNEFPTFRLDEELVDPWFMRAAISTDAFTRQADERSTGSTPTSRNRLKVDQFEQMTIPLPPISTQQVLGEHYRRLSIAANLTASRDVIARALLPAARNQEFAKLR